VQAGISENYLKWRGIEATLQLATSPNAKVVVVGGGSNGMPLILNTDDGASQRIQPPAQPPAAPVKVQKASAEKNSQINGSIDTAPPQANGMVEELISPGSGSTRRTGDAAMRLGVPPEEMFGNTAEDAPPYILRSFADAFGYRLQRIAPSTAEVIGPNERPR
jgi:hypothetical protein